MEIKNLSLKVGNKLLIKNFSYKFENNLIYNIYGENGSGKSSFVKAISGYIDYEGKSDFKKCTIGIVSSYTNIPEEVSVESVITFLRNQSNMTKEFQKTLYDMCNIENIIDRSKVSMLSDGEKKKLIIYATLNCFKDVLILDEFLSSLDKKSRIHMRNFIIDLHKTFRFVCLNITHSIEDAKIFKGEILFLNSESKQFTRINTIEQLDSLI